MNIGAISKLRLEDLPGAPPWVDRLLQALNPFISVVVTALTGRIEFESNIPAQKQLSTVVAGATAADNTLRFKCVMKTVPFGCFVVQAIQKEAQYTPLTTLVNVGSWRFDRGEIVISSFVGMTSGKTYDLLILVI